MSGSYEDFAEDKFLYDSFGALSDTKHDLPISPAITSDKSGHKNVLPSLFNDLSNAWPSNLWPQNTSPPSIPSMPSLLEYSASPAGSLQTASDLQRRNLHDAIEQYIRFIPRINRVNADNYGAILVDVVKETAEVLLEDFFRLLYTLQPSGSTPIKLDHDSLLLQFSTTEASLRGLAFCRLIHDTFMTPLFASTYFGVDNDGFSATKINPHEFHRIFLATKILLYCVKEAEGPHNNKAGLAKASIFNIYQIYILRLFSGNSCNLDRESSPASLILGQASIGRLMRMIFTNAGSKRLGKRGNSKYHFTGVAWRETALDNDVRHLIQLEPSQVKRHFENTIQKAHNKFVPAMKKSSTHMPKPDSIMQPAKSLQPPVVSTPFLSYVTSSSRFPAVDFSPRVKAICRRRVPEQPQWAREVMYRSIKALEQYNVYLRQPIEEFQAGDYGLGTQNSYYCVLVWAEKEFHEKGWEDAYLHLHIAILSSVLPAMIASDEEILPASKILIRASTRKLIKELEEKEVGRSPFEKNHRRMFMSNLQKMVNLSEATLVVLPKTHAADVLQVMIEDCVDLGKEGILSSGGTVLDDLCAKSVITMLNAYSQVFPKGTQDKVSMVNAIVENFREMCGKSIAFLLSLLKETKLSNPKIKVEALPFEFFKLCVESCHKWFLNKDVFLQIPIPVIRVFFTKLDREFQSRNFQGFGKRHPQIATERFKTSWWITSAFHEYFFLLSELVALSQRFE